MKRHTVLKKTTDVGFYNIAGSNIDRYITRPHFKERILTAARLDYIPMDIMTIRPYQLIERI